VTPRHSPAASTAVLAAILVAATLAACGTAQPVATPSPTTAPPSPALTPVPGGSNPASPVAGTSLPTQTDTEWGRIWDALPASFPLPPDATPTETGEGPASAVLDVSMPARQTAMTMQSALTGAGFTFDAMNGPAEDGSFTLEAVGPNPACKAQIRATPLGDSTVLTILYGAGCPFE
jgi:hypothetical protein